MKNRTSKSTRDADLIQALKKSAQNNTGLKDLWKRTTAYIANALSPIEDRITALEAYRVAHGNLTSASGSKTYTLESSAHYLLVLNAYGSTSPVANTEVVYLVIVGSNGYIRLSQLHAGTNASSYVTGRVSVTGATSGGVLTIAPISGQSPYVTFTLRKL